MNRDLIALGIVAVAGLYLVGLGVAMIFRPGQVALFLRGFARSAGAHYLELFIRLLVGLALVTASPGVPFGWAFLLFGQVLIATSALLVLVPWRWHRRFAETVVPAALRHSKLIGICSLSAGALVVAGTIAGATT